MRRLVPLAGLASLLLACGARQGEICYAPDGAQVEARSCGYGLTCELHTDSGGSTQGTCVARETLGESPNKSCGNDPGSGKPIPCDDLP